MAGIAAEQRSLSFTSDERWEFIEALDVQLAELRVQLRAFVDDGSPDEAGKQLVSRLRGLAGDAASFDEPLLSEELSDCEAVIRGSSVLGALGTEDRDHLDCCMARIDAYVKAERDIEAGSAEAPAVQTLVPPAHRGPGAQELRHLRILVIGADALAGRLSKVARAVDDGIALEVERIQELGIAHSMARAVVPDIVVIDADAEGARVVVEQLVADGLTDGIPIVAVGAWASGEEAAPLVALGVARCLAKPASPDAVRRACVEVMPLSGDSAFETIGETTVDALGARLAYELQRGLCDAADDDARQKPIDLGEGSEVLAALWGAVGRIRELVTASSKGAVRFEPTGPEVSMPSAPWVHGAERRARSDRAAALAEVRRSGGQHALDGSSVLVAEDDLSMNWFLSGVMREAGAHVHDAFDGRSAMNAAYRFPPHAVLADLVMPHIDGLTLCRHLKRDMLLRGVPFILLSWKEDLLQRARELGVGADGYLKKEATGSAILQRVTEVLQPRREVMKRIQSGGPVRGRLDGITSYGLLEMVCNARPDARVSVRDSLFVYDVEVRGGRPIAATRTSDDGGIMRGRDALSMLLGVGVGTFGVVETLDDVPDAQRLAGDLREQVRLPVAASRAVHGLLAGAGVVQIERVRIDRPRIAAQIDSMPDPLKGYLTALIDGASPRDLVGRAQASASDLEDVICYAARQGAVSAVFTRQGQDELPAAIEQELAVLDGVKDAEPVAATRGVAALRAVTDAFDDVTGATVPASPRVPDVAEEQAPPSHPTPTKSTGLAVSDDTPEEAVDEASPSIQAAYDAHLAEPGYDDEAYDASLTPSAPTPHDYDLLPADSTPGDAEFDALSPAFVGTDVGREWAPPTGSPLGVATHHTPSSRCSVDVFVDHLDERSPAAPVDEGASATPMQFDGVAPRHRTPQLASAYEHVGDFATLDAQPTQAPVPSPAQKMLAPLLAPVAPPATPVAEAVPAPPAAPPPAPQSAPAAPVTAADFLGREHPKVPRLPMPSNYNTRDRGDDRSRGVSRWLVPLLFAVVGIVFAIGARWYRENQTVAPVQPPVPVMQAPVTPGVQPPPPVAQPAAPMQPGAPVVAPPAVEQPVELPLGPEDQKLIKPGEGLLEVVAGRHNEIHIDGKRMGKGPSLKVSLQPGVQHEVRVKMRGEERVRYVTVQPGTRLRLRVAPPWSR